MLELYKKIREERERQHLSQEELARKVGYTNKSSIAKIEAGKVDISQSKIILFAKALDVTPGYLMGWEDKAQTKTETSDLNSEIYELLLSLSDSELKQVKAFVRGLSASNNENK